MQRYQHGSASNAAWDFSTNANCLGPCPVALEHVMAVDLSQYPRADYLELTQSLADWHRVDVSRVVLAASASELIMRLNMALRLMRSSDRAAPFVVGVPCPAYGDYVVAAQACGHTIGSANAAADAAWQALPSSPLGQMHAVENQCSAQLHWLDCAYLPLLLSGQAPQTDEMNHAWQIWTPNKALGLCGIRGAYAIAPIEVNKGFEDFATAVLRLEPSWVLGAASVAMLQAWVSEPVQTWLTISRQKLLEFKARQMALLHQLSIQTQPSHTNFMCVQLDQEPRQHQGRLEALRQQGIALRDTTNMGLAGWARMRVHTPSAQDAFVQAFSKL